MFFKRKKKKEKQFFYMKGYACSQQHCQTWQFDNICAKCGENVKPAVCKGFTHEILLLRVVYSNSFVRWIYND